ncbi:MAG TPA: AMP-binding protein [Acidimicrobiales bacterium]|nr:AMP-binding protein [Acidimicrobiales bacterium]
MAPSVPAGVFDVLRLPLSTDPGAPALVTRSGVLSYAELDAEADRAAAAFHALGIRPGDRIGVSLPNDAAIVIAFHGAMRLGAVWVGINQALAPPEKAYMLVDSGAVLLLADDAVADALAGAEVGIPTRLVRPAEWSDACMAAAAWPRERQPDPEAPAAIAYTSGTTGFPKGAVHCQAGLLLPGAATVARRGWGSGLRKGDSLPLTILNMLTLTTLLTAQAGGTAVIMDRADVASIVEWIRAERVSVWNGPPAQLWTMVRDDSIEPSSLSSLDEVWVGGGDCPDSLRRDFEARFGVKVCRTYGLTEAPALVCLDDIEGLPPEGTSGRPLDHVSVDTSDGEIVLRPNPAGAFAGAFRPALGYWGRPEAAEGVLEGRTLRTGDLGVLEESGHLRVLGRKSTVIIRGGANVYPAEVERVLVEAPGVAACAVVGVPDERLGERVGAALEPATGGDVDLAVVVEHCRANLAAYKIPERWAVVERLPRNQMGKVPAPAVLELIRQASAG